MWMGHAIDVMKTLMLTFIFCLIDPHIDMSYYYYYLLQLSLYHYPWVGENSTSIFITNIFLFNKGVKLRTGGRCTALKTFVVVTVLGDLIS